MQAITNTTVSAVRPMTRQRMLSVVKQKGVTLTELIVSVVVMVLIVGFVFFLKGQVYGPLLGWMEASAVSTAIGKIENVYSGSANYTGLTTASMATPSIFQAKYLPGGAVINNRFGGQVALGIATINTTSDTMTYTDGGVRSDSCPTLVNQLAEDADRISVAGTVVKAVNGNLQAGLLKTQCDSANTVAVMFERIKRS